MKKAAGPPVQLTEKVRLTVEVDVALPVGIDLAQLYFYVSIDEEDATGLIHFAPADLRSSIRLFNQAG